MPSKRRIYIEGFLIDDDNEEKFAEHGLRSRQIAQVLENEHLILRNRKHRHASYLVIGRDHSGQCIAMAVEPTHEPTIWRPVTAWPCKKQEMSLLG